MADLSQRIETAAQVLYEHEFDAETIPWDHVTDDDRANYVHVATAVVAALDKLDKRETVVEYPNGMGSDGVYYERRVGELYEIPRPFARHAH